VKWTPLTGQFGLNPVWWTAFMRVGIEPTTDDYEVGANGRNGPLVSVWSEICRDLVRWCRFGPVVSDWYVG
jgi:hypothetical protein